MQLDLELYCERVEVEPGIYISYIDVAPEKPLQTLVLIHGFGGRARQWRYQIENFSLANRVVAIDLRGHGDSSRPAGHYTMDQILADITAVVDNLALNAPFAIVGHSFGVALATEFAYRYPDRVSHLILIAGAGEYNIPAVFKLLFRLPPALIRFLQPIGDLFVDASLPSLRRLYMQNLRTWRGWELFPALKPATMVILGNRDRVLPQEAFARVGEMVPPSSEVINVGVSAHMVMLERRDAVNRAIERFITDHKIDVQHSRWRADSGQGGRGSLLRERPWLANYESDVPPTIHIPKLPLTRLLDRAWRRFPRRPAIIFAGRKLTYTNVSGQSARLANALQALGIEKGTRIIILLPNVPQLVIAYYSVLRIGGVVVMANPLARTAEIVREAQRTAAEVIITLTRFAETAVSVKRQSPVRHIIYTHIKDYMPLRKRLLFPLRRELAAAHRYPQTMERTDFVWPQLLRKHPSEPPQVEISLAETAVIQFTSGTTAEPKGVMLSHANLVANVMQIRAWMTDLKDGQDSFLCVVPFSHVYGMSAAMNIAISAGASMILVPQFDVKEVLEQIRKYRPAFFPGVPSMYVALNGYPGVRRFNVDSIRACISGAAPLPIEVKEAFEKLTRGKLVEGYGLSEASPVTHANPIYGQNKIGAIGVPLPNTEARIVDLKTGIPLPPGEIGELVIRGPQVMRGYWQDEAATAAVIDDDGWLHTNDIARMDADGYFQIISRRQDMWEDENETPAFPRDVEEVIYELPEVREVVVVAPFNQPIAFVNLAEKTRIPAKTIISFCRRRLPPSQVPRLVIFVPDFPRSFIGKVLRRELISQYQHQITAEAGSVGDHLAGLNDS